MWELCGFSVETRFHSCLGLCELHEEWDVLTRFHQLWPNAARRQQKECQTATSWAMVTLPFNYLQQMWSRSNNDHGRGTASCGPFVHVLDVLDSRCRETWILAWSPQVFRGGAASCDHWSCCPFPQHMVFIQCQLHWIHEEGVVVCLCVLRVSFISILNINIKQMQTGCGECLWHQPARLGVKRPCELCLIKEIDTVHQSSAKLSRKTPAWDLVPGIVWYFSMAQKLTQQKNVRNPRRVKLLKKGKEGHHKVT